MVKSKFILAVLLFSLVIISLNFVFAAAVFQFNGTVKDENGNILANATINITVRNQNGWSIVGYNSTTTNSSGWFNLTVGDDDAWVYEPIITRINTTNPKINFTDYISKTIPAFNNQMMPILAGATFYLTPAGTINLTAVNSSGGRTYFQYQIKDTKLGYPVASNMGSYVNESAVIVPSSRNYSIMVYPYQSMPVSFEWNNFSSANSYNFSTDFSNLNVYNASSKTLHKQFNLTMTVAVVFGYINCTLNNYVSYCAGINNWTNLTIIPYLLEPGNMVHAQYGAMPYNMSAMLGPTYTDYYNLTNGFYNISLPATLETSHILLFASAINATDYYGAFKNISIAYSLATPVKNFNFSVTGLLGSSNSINMQRMGAGGNIDIPTKKQMFYLINASNSNLSSVSAHVEIKIDYSLFNATQFTWMAEISQSQGLANFSIPLLNITGIKEVNVFASGGSGGGSGQYAPKRTSFTVSELNTNPNITIKNFNPGAIDASVSAGSINIALYISNSTCDVPNPPSSCYVGGPASANSNTNMASFNPMQAVMGGGKISFRMGTGNISVHYVNVDMMASGPPDALFDSNTNNMTSGNTFAAALRFGSGGPTIYDYVLVSVPYADTAGVGLNDSAQVNMSIPVLYDDNWNIIWNATVNGTSAAGLSGNQSHYSDRQTEWVYLLNSSICGTDVSILNASNPCYLDTTNNKIWIRLPHFSGTGPTITGSAVASPSTTTTTTTTTTTGSTTFWAATHAVTDQQFIDGFTKELYAKHRLQIRINNTNHYVGVVSLTSTTATINVSSNPQQTVFNIGTEKKFDVTGDGYYDIIVKLNNIVSSKANVTVKSISEQAPVIVTSPTNQSLCGNNKTDTGENCENCASDVKCNTGEVCKNAVCVKQTSSKTIIFIVIIILIIAVAVFLIIQINRRRHKAKGY